MHVSGAPLVSFSCFQCVGCGAKLSRIKATFPLEKGYSVPYHRDIAFGADPVSFRIASCLHSIS